jgi:hypothetical protein
MVVSELIAIFFANLNNTGMISGISTGAAYFRGVKNINCNFPSTKSGITRWHHSIF